MTHRVSIGLPTYNRPELLRQAVASLQAQTHHDLDILISDNASTDPRSMETIKELAASDPRIRYVRRLQNDGPGANFKSVLDAANTPFFMWASDDDIWDKHFVERCLALLDRHPEAQMAFGSVDNINLDGTVVRTLSGFSRFTSSDDRRSDARRFIAEPEILGKANLVYGLYRRPAIKAVADICWPYAEVGWAGDVVLIFGFITRYSIVTTDEVLLHKRVFWSSAQRLNTRDPRTYLIPPQHVFSLIRRHKIVAPDASIASIVTPAFIRRELGNSLYSVVNKQFWRDAGAKLVRAALKSLS
jgi:glycosyltransferase involved in cell wall biosynthesis